MEKGDKNAGKENRETGKINMDRQAKTENNVGENHKKTQSNI